MTRKTPVSPHVDAKASEVELLIDDSFDQLTRNFVNKGQNVISQMKRTCLQGNILIAPSFPVHQASWMNHYRGWFWLDNQGKILILNRWSQWPNCYLSRRFCFVFRWVCSVSDDVLLANFVHRLSDGSVRSLKQCTQKWYTGHWAGRSFVGSIDFIRPKWFQTSDDRLRSSDNSSNS